MESRLEAFIRDFLSHFRFSRRKWAAWTRNKPHGFNNDEQWRIKRWIVPNTHEQWFFSVTPNDYSISRLIDPTLELCVKAWVREGSQGWELRCFCLRNLPFHLIFVIFEVDKQVLNALEHIHWLYILMFGHTTFWHLSSCINQLQKIIDRLTARGKTSSIEKSCQNRVPNNYFVVFLGV